VDNLLNLSLSSAEIRATGFPLSQELIVRERIIMQGTWEAAKAALQHGVALNIAGGTHHAFADKGEGFCLLNDQAIAAQLLLNAGLSRRVLIVDLDVHQGNGTASIFHSRKDVFTFSMHGEKNYPLHKMESHLDIALADGTGDDAYLALLEKHLLAVINDFQPDFIFYQSGVDVLASDALGRLALSIDGCKKRDEFVLRLAFDQGLPLCISMGGGYSKDIRVILEAHCNTFRLASRIFG
jgi:acetoin utilization deacetylase AcuC-like enzyme